MKMGNFLASNDAQFWITMVRSEIVQIYEQKKVEIHITHQELAEMLGLTSGMEIKEVSVGSSQIVIKAYGHIAQGKS